MDSLVLSIMHNFDDELKKYNSKQPNKFEEYFSKNKINSFKQLTMVDNSIVLGNKIKGQVEGLAIVKYENGTHYIGNYVNGQRSGFGYRSYPGKDLFYVGEYKNDIKEGKGKLWKESAKKWVYDGMWSRDLKNGQGYLIRDEGTYEGSWLNDKLHGKGKMDWVNGDTYEGEYKDDLRHGFGKMRFKNGDTYEGTFVGGQMHGQGRYVWRNGEIFEGNFKNGVMDGEGKIEYSQIRIKAQGVFQGGSDKNLFYGLDQN